MIDIGLIQIYLGRAKTCLATTILGLLNQSTFEDWFILAHSHYVGLDVDPNHHHLATKSRLTLAYLLQFGSVLQIFCCKVALYFLVRLRIVQSINISNSHQLFVFFWKHRSHGFNTIAFIHLTVEFPLVDYSFSKELLFFAKESKLALLIFLRDIVKNLEAIYKVKHV